MEDMKIDMTAGNLYLSYLEGETDFDEMWDTRPFQMIREFSQGMRRFGSSKEEIKEALERAENINRNGLGSLEENLHQVKDFFRTIENKEEEWTDTIEEELNRVIPEEDSSDLTIYPLPSLMDYGIAMEDGVCINLNQPIFFENPREFVYIAIHECAHCLYAQGHGAVKLGKQDLESPEDKETFLNMVLHNEGFAVYTPLGLRKREGNMGKKSHPALNDYLIISDETKMKKQIKKYDSFLKEFEKNVDEWSLEELIEGAMAKERHPFRIGGWIYKELEEKKGLDEVRGAFYMDADEFVEEYDHLLDRLR